MTRGGSTPEQVQHEMNAYASRADVEALLDASFTDLLANDAILLQNNVGERTIVHKLAEHLQRRFSYLNVDCEYNRDVTRGENAPKSIYLLSELTREERNRAIGIADEAELATISTYPDIVVHQRGTNDYNLLVVEVKKANNSMGHGHDLEKLRCFTEDTEQNAYRYRFGAFVVLRTGIRAPESPRVRWFQGGRET